MLFVSKKIVIEFVLVLCTDIKHELFRYIYKNRFAFAWQTYAKMNTILPKRPNNITLVYKSEKWGCSLFSVDHISISCEKNFLENREF